MSVSFGCHCGERKKEVSKRAWRVLQRECNHSAFNGYHWTPSDYSTIFCMRCGEVGRTKAGYVSELKDGTDEEFDIARESGGAIIKNKW